jgi:hypothetical protein
MARETMLVLFLAARERTSKIISPLFFRGKGSLRKYYF